MSSDTPHGRRRRVDNVTRPLRRRAPPLVVVAAGLGVMALLGAMVLVGVGMGSSWWGSMGGHMGSSTRSGAASAVPVAGASRVEVRAGDVWFEPDVLEIAAGDPVNIVVENEGRVFHDFTLDELDFTIGVGAGDTVTGGLEKTEPGEYEFVCSVPGHAAAGMRGTLVVQRR